MAGKGKGKDGRNDGKGKDGKGKDGKAKVARQEFILESPLGNAAALCSSLQPDHVAVLFFLRVLQVRVAEAMAGTGNCRWQTHNC